MKFLVFNSVVSHNKLNGLSKVYQKCVATFGLKSDALNFNLIFPSCSGCYFFLYQCPLPFFNCSSQFNVSWGPKLQALLIQCICLLCITMCQALWQIQENGQIRNGLCSQGVWCPEVQNRHSRKTYKSNKVCRQM